MLPQKIEEVTKVMMGSNADLVQQAFMYSMETEEDLSVASDILITIKERIKGAEAERTALVKPINDSVRNINAKFKTVTEPLKEAEYELKKKILAVQVEIEKRKREDAEKERAKREVELLREAEEKASIGNEEGAKKTLEIAANLKTHVEETGRGGFTGAKSSIKKIWTFVVVDIAALAKSHPEMVQVNSSAVHGAIRNGEREIEGIKIYQKETLAIR